MKIDDLISLNLQEELTKTLLFSLFSDRMVDGKVVKAQYPVNQPITIKIQESPEVLASTKLKTTLGRYVFNKFCLPKVLFTANFFINEQVTKKQFKKLSQSVADQINEQVTKKQFKKLSQSVADQINESLISEEEFAQFTDRLHWIGSQFVNTIGDSFDSTSLNISDDTLMKIKELVDKVDVTSNVSIDKTDAEIVKILKKELKDTPVGRIVESGAKGGWEANIKPLLGVRGLINGEYSKNSLFGGIDLDTYSRINSLFGSFSRFLIEPIHRVICVYKQSELLGSRKAQLTTT